MEDHPAYQDEHHNPDGSVDLTDREPTEAELANERDLAALQAFDEAKVPDLEVLWNAVKVIGRQAF